MSSGTSTYPIRRSPRLSSYDYSAAGAYFITLCTHGRLCRFGAIHGGAAVLSVTGQIVARAWVGLEHHQGVGVDAFVVMPNHLHGVLVLSLDAHLSLSEVIRRFKTYSAHEVRRIQRHESTHPAGTLWQRNFHERVIRNDRELTAIREYIAANPLRWHLDRENPD